MPTYEYLCQTCSHRFEVWQKMSDEPLHVCPECGNSIRRVLYPAGIVFKGSGFYKTDHRDSSSGVRSEESKKAESVGANGSSSDTTASKSSEQSPESKPATSSTSNSSHARASASESKVLAGTAP